MPRKWAVGNAENEENGKASGSTLAASNANGPELQRFRAVFYCCERRSALLELDIGMRRGGTTGPLSQDQIKVGVKGSARKPTCCRPPFFQTDCRERSRC